MKPAIIFLLLLSVTTTNRAQNLIERFDDGNFDENPTWTGNANLFTVTNGELQLRDLAPPANGTAYLAVAAPTDISQATTWEFYVRLAFAPSTTNFARVYLSANAPQLDGALNGYFVRIGGVSGDADAVELFRQNGTTNTLLISGQSGGVALEPAIARVRITRSTSGEWSLSADYTGGTNFVAQGTPVTDVVHPVGSFAGVYCRYTGTRAQAFFFDDIIIDPLYSDTAPPVLDSAVAESANNVLLSFNEPLEAASAGNAGNYLINNGIGQPASAQLTANPTQVRLQLASALVNLQSYQVSAAGIRDATGNAAGTQTTNFTFYNIQPAQPGDLIVTEFMPDPSPVISNLPEVEYLELYNRSNKVLQLQDISYSNGGTPQPLPSFFLLPGKYVIVCSQSNAATFAAFGDVAGMNSFPALTNSGDEIILSNAQGDELFYLEYDLSWYRDPAKTEGGWSIERIGNDLPDNCPANWRASIHPRGGTPGQANSVQGTPDDSAGPMLLRAALPTASSIIVTFDEPLSEAGLSAA
ncbi:MAG: lamin tail domain-containing protein, partial [Saprospiraceae bacterium]|nr:lamin tail domain-containing protein [Saprospiraceae bacterium]